MSHPLPTDVRIRYERTTFRDLYRAWLMPAKEYLGIVQKHGTREWGAIRPESSAPYTFRSTRAEAGEVLRKLHEVGESALDR